MPHGTSGRHVGLSISDEWIRLVALEETQGGLAPVAAVAQPTPAESVRHGSIINAAAVTAAISGLLSAHGLTAEAVRLAVEGEDIIVRIVELPVTGTRELYTSVLSEIEDFGLFGADEAAMGYQVVEQFEREGVRNTRVLVSAAQRQMVQAYQNAVTRAGAEPTALEAAMLASLRAVGGATGEDGGPHLVVRLTAPLTEMAIVADQKLLFSHGFAPTSAEYAAEAGDDDFLAIGDSWESLAAAGIDVEDAEAEGHPAEEEARLQEVLAETLRSLAFFERRFADFGAIRNVVILADSARAGPAQEILAARLPVPVEMADLLRTLYLPSTAAPEVAPLLEDPGAFAAALGACLGSVPAYSGQFEADLFPRVEDRQPPRAAFWASLAMVALTALLLAGLTAGSLVKGVKAGRELRTVQAQAQKLEKEFPGGKQGLESLKGALEEAHKAIEDAGKVAAPQEWSKKLEAVRAALPPGVYLTRMAVRGGKDISLEGTAGSQDAVGEFAQRLLASAGVRQAMIASVENVAPGSPTVKFKLDCKL